MVMTEDEFIANGTQYVFEPYMPVFVFACSYNDSPSADAFREFDLRIFYRAPNVTFVSDSILHSDNGVRISSMGSLANKTDGAEYRVLVFKL